MPLEVLDLLLALLRQCVDAVARLKACEVVKPSDIIFSTVEAVVSPVSFIKAGFNLLMRVYSCEVADFYFSYNGSLIIVYELWLYPLVDTVLLLLGLGPGFFDALDNAHLNFLLLVFYISDGHSVKPS
jgi:hypothetical protein